MNRKTRPHSVNGSVLFGGNQRKPPLRKDRRGMIRALCLSSYILYLSVTMLFAGDPESQATVESVRAIENHWARAFVTGDTAYLQSLLADDYVSVNQSGRARPKSEI